MPRSVRLLALVLLLPGCADSLGINLDCALEQQQVLRREGPPDVTQKDEVGGNHVVQWRYEDTRQLYTFRWGPSHNGCDVTGPVRFHRSA